MKGNQADVAARRRVVAGVDGSPNSLLALRRAAFAARLCHACVELVRVLPSDAPPATQMAGLRTLGMALRCEFPAGPGVPVRYTVECGDPAEILVKRSAGAELLVGHGRHRVGLIVDVPRPDGQPPFIVKWLSDGHIAMVFPDRYARVIPAGHPAGTGLSRGETA